MQVKQKIKPYSFIRLGFNPRFFVAIDFDGTITDMDITDAIIKKFARPEWEHSERLWEAGVIGSRECLSTQMSLIDTPLDKVLDYAGTFAIKESFPEFVSFLRRFRIPFGIISDGFQPIIEKLLSSAGLHDLPIYSNQLTEGKAGLKAVFPYTNDDCSSGTCKCMVAKEIGHGLPLVHIGDGRSDFCISEKAVHVFSKKKLTDYCKTRGIDHSSFTDFRTIEAALTKVLLNKTFATKAANESAGNNEVKRETGRIAG